MSKTHKHQKKYLATHWWRNHWQTPYIKVHHRGYIYWITPPPENDHYPYPEWTYGIEEGRASKYYKQSYKKLRHKWTRLLHENDEWKTGKESLKPENVDYLIW
jgi:hypothetical protein